MIHIGFIGACIGLTIGSFVYQAVLVPEPDYARALDISFHQLIAVWAAWLVVMFCPKK